MAISKIILNGITQMDLTADTVEASNLIAPNTAHKNDGTQVTGTATGGGNNFIITLTWDDNEEMWLPDKTFAEIQSAVATGKTITTYAYDETLEIPLRTSCSATSDNMMYYVETHEYDSTTTTILSYYMNANGIWLDDSWNLYETYDATAVPSDVAQGKIFYNSDGLQTGTASGGGSSSWTKVAETSYQASTTSTNAAIVDTWATGHSELWTNEKIVYVRIRDTEGKRAGYFYGSDNFFIIPPTNATSNQTSMRNIHRYTTTPEYASYGTGATTGYGVFADILFNDGRIRIRKRYNSSYSLTVDGTYSVEVYLLDPPTGAPIFE